MRKQLCKLAILGMLLSLLLASTIGAQGKVTLVIDEMDDSAFPAMRAVVTVVDPNGVPIPGLTQDKFELSENGKPVSVSQVTPSINPQVKIAVALAIDASGSMRGKPFQDARNAVITFLNGLGVADEVAIVIFANRVNLGEPFPKIDPKMEADFTPDKGALKNLLTLADAVEGARTPLYDAAFKAVKMTARQPVGRRAVILFTDGNEKRADERGSILQADDPIAEANKYGIPIFTIGLGPKADAEYLQRVAVRTGGTYAYAEKSEELAALFQDISQRLKQQYVLEWNSNTAVDYADHAGVVKVRTSVGDAEATFSFKAAPAGVWIRQLHLKVEKKPLEEGQVVEKVVIVEPEVYTRNTITKVEYYVDGKLVWTAVTPPFSFAWDTLQVGEGSHTLTVKAYDNAPLPNVGEKVVSLTVRVPPPPPWIPIWALVGIGVAVLALVVGVVLSRRRRLRVCPTCGRVMDPGWSECLFCASERATGVSAEAPSVEGFEPITAFEERPLEPQIGVVPGIERPVAPPETISLRPKPQPLAWLIVKEGERVGKEFRLHEGDTSIGRAGDNDIIISDPTVSRQHAKVRLEGGAFYIYDLGAINPTKVNEEVITKHRLEEGDHIRIGNTVLVFKRV